MCKSLSSSLSNFLLCPLGILYGLLMKVRNLLYDWHILRITKVKTTVVSIGNLTVGGTGKTPLVDSMLSYFEKKGKRVAVVTRGYKGRYKGIQKVKSLSVDADEIFGDEATWLAARHPQSAIFVGTNKTKTCEHVACTMKPDLIIVDDGFQHRSLYRQFDLVLLDAMSPLSDYRPFPWGRAREGWSSLRRASRIAITRKNVARDETMAALLNQLNIEKISMLLIFLEYTICCFRQLAKNKGSRPADMKSPCLAVSAIGSPKSFETLLTEQAKVDLAGHQIYPDHHKFTDQDLQKIFSMAEQSSAKWICITAKDAVKLKKLTKDERFWIADLELEPNQSLEKVYAQIESLLV